MANFKRGNPKKKAPGRGWGPGDWRWCARLRRMMRRPQPNVDLQAELLTQIGSDMGLYLESIYDEDDGDDYYYEDYDYCCEDCSGYGEGLTFDEVFDQEEIDANALTDEPE